MRRSARRSRFVLEPNAGLELPLRGVLDADADRCAAVPDAEDDEVGVDDAVPVTFKLELLCGGPPFAPVARFADESYWSCNGGN